MKARTIKMQLTLAPVTTDLGGTKTMSWRTIRPVFHDENCIKCGLCATFCPEGVVFQRDEEGHYCPDYEYCKGCGVCAAECPKECIEMIADT
jgi:pyruvate ferredoxin oxidoreductase delta subunit